LFRDSFGQSFSDHVEALRIRDACARLGRTASSGEEGGRTAIKDVAAAVGFASDTTFRRAFHRVLGLSPSEYERAAGRRD
jgi:transcriptional regulator GlxA family with amidase domain